MTGRHRTKVLPSPNLPACRFASRSVPQFACRFACRFVRNPDGTYYNPVTQAFDQGAAIWLVSRDRHTLLESEEYEDRAGSDSGPGAARRAVWVASHDT